MKKKILVFFSILSMLFINIADVYADECKNLSKADCSGRCSWSMSSGCFTLVPDEDLTKSCSELGMTSCNYRDDCSWSTSKGCMNFYGEVVDSDDSTKACSELGMASCNKRDDCSWSTSKGCMDFYGEVVDSNDSTKACGELEMASCNKRDDCSWSASTGCSTKTTSDLNICTSSGSLHAIYIALKIIDLAKIAIPLILIVMMTIDIFKVITNPDNVRTVKEIVFKRLLAALIIFFIPTLNDMIINSLGDNYNSDYVQCIKNAPNWNDDKFKEQSTSSEKEENTPKIIDSGDSSEVEYQTDNSKCDVSTFAQDVADGGESMCIKWKCKWIGGTCRAYTQEEIESLKKTASMGACSITLSKNSISIYTNTSKSPNQITLSASYSGYCDTTNTWSYKQSGGSSLYGCSINSNGDNSATIWCYGKNGIEIDSTRSSSDTVSYGSGSATLSVNILGTNTSSDNLVKTSGCYCCGNCTSPLKSDKVVYYLETGMSFQDGCNKTPNSNYKRSTTNTAICEPE